MATGGARIDKTLRVYEELCWFRWAAWQYEEKGKLEHTVQFEGGIKNFRQLRARILNIQPFSDVSDAAKPYELPAVHKIEFPIMNLVPRFLMRWTSESRRIFHVSRQAVAQMMATTFKSLRWRDVQWPFRCFAMSFENPVDAEGIYDFYLVNVTHEMLEVLMLSRQTDQSLFLSSRKREEIETLLRRNRLKRVYEEIQKIQTSANTHIPPIAFSNVLMRSPDQFISDALSETYRIGQTRDDEVRHIVEQSPVSALPARVRSSILSGLEHGNDHRAQYEINIHLPVALGLYLTAISAGYAHITASLWEKEQKRKIIHGYGRVISDEAEVCFVDSTILFAQGEVEAIERCPSQTLREVSPHFRRFHMRRPPGHGDDPEYPKIVPVSATIVHKDKLQPGQLPIGATMIVEREE